MQGESCPFLRTTVRQPALFDGMHVAPRYSAKAGGKMLNFRGLAAMRVAVAGLALGAVGLSARQAGAESVLRPPITAGDPAVPPRTAAPASHRLRSPPCT